jgi:NADPH-dependent ferric siderophore reductase
MEILTLDKIKRKAERFFEPQHLQTGRVLEVRHWELSTLIEIDLHLPFADMWQWIDVPYIKFKVAPFAYRDYTPSGWDDETSTCTIYVDAAHNGPGSNWAKQLQKHDEVSYYKIGSTDQTPEITSAVIALGDESSLGHMLALQQMVMPVARFSGAVVMGNDGHRSQFREFFRSPLQTVKRDDTYGHHSLIQWVIDQQYALENTVFYLTGNNIMVSQMKRMLRLLGYSSSQIKTKGFWS